MFKITRHALISALVLAVGLTSAPDTASAYYSLLGGETLKVRDSALEVQAGYPEVRLAYHIPIIENLVITPRITMFYQGLGRYVTSTAPFGKAIFGMGFGADIKYRVFEKKGVHLAVIAPLSVNFRFTDAFVGAVQIGVPGGVEVTWEANKTINLVGGVRFPFAIGFGSGTGGFLYVPLVASIGAEFAVTDQINLTATFEGGGIIGHCKGLTSTGTYVAGLVGVQYRL